MTGSAVSRAISRLTFSTARWAYFQKGNGPMFVYNTERLRTLYGGPGDGKFESCVFRPVGKGSRSGRAERWTRDDSTSSFHYLRRDAKARALRLFEEWEASQEGTA